MTNEWIQEVEKRIAGLLFMIKETKEKRDRLETKLTVLQSELSEAQNSLARLNYEEDSRKVTKP